MASLGKEPLGNTGRWAVMKNGFVMAIAGSMIEADIIVQALAAQAISSAPAETAMALWEAVLDHRQHEMNKTDPAAEKPLVAAFEGNGFSEMRSMAAELIPAAEEAWGKIGLDYENSWDWEFLPIVVSLWIEAGFDASAVTAEMIIAAAMPKKEG